ncbi:hypothetical protein [Rugosimonospora africana]|uniref:Uncharacterized protein n=1 Tax=Rugosimonospora africana TaxID=556532 RepID=A0A8J3VW49_9ACTN|nr:hypothetical protein [Rugosimonospora africana]GIH21372.1 hypothetical protein Raf01_95440 [Rugosimonospora africana]
MTATGDIIAAVQVLIQQLHQSVTATNAAAQRAEQARGAAAALGHAQGVATFGAIHQTLAEVQQGIGPLIDRARTAITQAQAAEGG